MQQIQKSKQKKGQQQVLQTVTPQIRSIQTSTQNIKTAKNLKATTPRARKRAQKTKDETKTHGERTKTVQQKQLHTNTGRRQYGKNSQQIRKQSWRRKL